MASRFERYMAHLDRLSGGVEPRFFPVESTKPGPGNVTTMVYDGVPDGLLTALTYGVSLVEPAEPWNGAPELCLSVRSTDVIWAHALGYIAESLRGSCPFVYGNTINFNERMASGSEMTAFFVFAPSVLDRADYTGVDVGIPGHEGHDVVNIRGLYPIHDVELQFINEHGYDAFCQLDWDAYDVRRQPAV